MVPGPRPEPDVPALVRGDLPPGEACALRARAASDPALREEIRAVEALFAACRSAFDPADDPREAARLAAAVRDRVLAEEARAGRERRVPVTSLRLFWARVLAASVVAHALLLLALLVLGPGREGPADDPRGLLANFPSPRLEDEAALAPEVDWPREGLARLPDPLFPSEETDEPVVPEEAQDLPALRDRLREHPPTVALDMLVRTDDALKRRRLERLDLDPDGTLTRVRRGLGALARMQRADGSFPAGGGRSEVGETAVALLPFLAEGRGSGRGPSEADGVARGVAWLRARLFASDGPGVLRRPTGVPTAELGMALAALAEDYMISYGRLSPADGVRRVREMNELGFAIASAQRADGGFEGAEEDAARAVWPVWGLYAGARTGTLVPAEGTLERFSRWYAERPRTAEGVPAGPDGRPDALLAAAGLLFSRRLGPAFDERAGRQAGWVVRHGMPEGGTSLYAATAGVGLLLHDPSSFRVWSRESAEALAARLLPTGVAREGDPVGDTALLLLALQAGYRTF